MDIKRYGNILRFLKICFRLFHRALSKEELEMPVSLNDFEEAIRKVNKSVSKEDLEKYERWMNEYGSM